MKIGRYPSTRQDVIKNMEDAAKDSDNALYMQKLRKKIMPGLMNHERNLVVAGKLYWHRHTEEMVFFKARMINQIERTNHKEAKYWYRCMTREDFEYLIKNNKVNVDGENNYGGIAPCFSYCSDTRYFGNDKAGDHIIEFKLPGNGQDFIDQVWEVAARGKKKFKGADPKSESGCISIGLGPKGFYAGTAGVIFNKMLDSREIEWRLVNFRVANPISDDPKYYLFIDNH
jgi:hypothetical protein